MRLEHQPEIESLRAIAVLSVLTYHFFPKLLPGGFTGVDIFFVISGYLITRIILVGLTNQSFSLAEFYRRRIRRIFPALLLVMLFVLMAGWFVLFAGEYTQLGQHVVASCLFLQNFMLYSESGYFDQSAEMKPLLHLWSLSVEEQFYVIWPPLLMLWSNKGWRFRVLLWGLFLSSFSLNLWIRHTNPSGDFFWPTSRFWELLIGSILVLLPSRPALNMRINHLSRITGGFGVLLIGLGVTFINPRMAFPGLWALLPTLGTALVITAGHWGPKTPRERNRSVMAYLGRISYPLYLWHWPLLSLGHIMNQGAMTTNDRLTLMIVTFGLASLTYHGLEKPARKSTNWILPGSLAFAMIVLASLGTVIFSYGGFTDRKIEAHNPNRTELFIPGFESLASECMNLGASERVLPHCKTLNGEASTRPTIFLWGDSSAIAWTPLFLAIAKDKDFRLIVVGHPSCPPLLSARKTHFDLPESARYCQDGQLQWDVLHLIEKVSPDLIVFMGALGGYRTDAGVAREDTEFMRDDAGGEANRQTNEKTLKKRIPETLDRLSTIAPVLVFRNWPLLPAALPPPEKRRLGDVMTRDTQARSYDRAYFDAQRGFVDDLFEKHHSDHMDFFDPSTAVCDQKFCFNQIDGISAYSDRYHVTPTAALYFRNPIESILDDRLKKREGSSLSPPTHLLKTSDQ